MKGKYHSDIVCKQLEYKIFWAAVKPIIFRIWLENISKRELSS